MYDGGLGLAILFIYGLMILVKTLTFGVGGGNYQNSFIPISYDVFKYNNYLDGTYFNRNNKPNNINNQSDLYIAACTCHKDFFINYFYQASGFPNTSFESYTQNEDYLSYQNKALDFLNTRIVDNGFGRRGYGGARTGYNFFNFKNTEPYIVVGYAGYGGRTSYSPFHLLQNQIYFLSTGSFESLARGPSIGTNISYHFDENVSLIFQFHYMNLNGVANINSSAFNWSGNKISEYFKEGQSGEIKYEGIEAQIGMKVNAIKYVFPYFGIVFTHFNSRFAMDESWKMTGTLKNSTFSMDKYLITKLNPPTFKSQETYLGIRFNLEFNFAPFTDGIDLFGRKQNYENGNTEKIF